MQMGQTVMTRWKSCVGCGSKTSSLLLCFRIALELNSYLHTWVVTGRDICKTTICTVVCTIEQPMSILKSVAERKVCVSINGRERVLTSIYLCIYQINRRHPPPLCAIPDNDDYGGRRQKGVRRGVEVNSGGKGLPLMKRSPTVAVLMDVLRYAHTIGR